MDPILWEMGRSRGSMVLLRLLVFVPRKEIWTSWQSLRLDGMRTHQRKTNVDTQTDERWKW